MLIAAFVAAHLVFWSMAVTGPGVGFADIHLYRHWAFVGTESGAWPVLDGPWVYPALALIVVWLPSLASASELEVYVTAWIAMVAALNAAAALTLWRRHPLGAAWWIAFLVILGPVAFGRIDAVATPLAIIGLLAATQHPRVAAVLFTIGAWIKVAPGVLVMPLAAIARRPVRDVVVTASVACAVVVGLVALGGGLRNIASFATTQEGRGLQLESVAASWWVLDRLAGGPSEVVYNDDLFTREIVGPGTAQAAIALNWLLPIVAAALGVLTWRARRRMDSGSLLCWSALALTLALIVTNKVGSPQFVGWIAAPVAVGLASWAQQRRSGYDSTGFSPGGLAWLNWPLVASVLLGIAAVTQILVPWGYGALLAGSVPLGLMLVLRNVALVAVFAGAVAKLVALGRRAHADAVRTLASAIGGAVARS